MSRSAIPPWPTVFSTGWCTTRTASRCAASPCAKSAAVKNEDRRCAPNPARGAVEMPPHGKRGKLPERVSHSFHRAWKSGKERPDSHISTAPAAGLFMTKEMKNDGDKTEFQLTDSITSSTIGTPASLRSENDQLHLGTSDWDPIGITNHLHRNKQVAGGSQIPDLMMPPGMKYGQTVQ